jgi:hypothetical protein
LFNIANCQEPGQGKRLSFAGDKRFNYIYADSIFYLPEDGPMICPQCGTEYRDGFTDCADCHIPLITGTAKDWAGEDKDEYVTFVPVYTTGNQAFMAVAKSVLESAGILYTIRNEQVQNVWGFGSLGNNISPMIIEVEKERAEEAKELLKELEQGGLETDDNEWGGGDT